jgi:CheY-like chemotaxis protein
MAASAILFVDEDHDTCASLSDILSDLGYRVGVDYDGPAALDQSRRPPPYGLAVLDSKLPGMDGVDLYGHLRNVRADTVGVPVAPSAKAVTVQAADRAGIRRALPKPVDFGRLIPLTEEVTGARCAWGRGGGKRSDESRMLPTLPLASRLRGPRAAVLFYLPAVRPGPVLRAVGEEAGGAGTKKKRQRDSGRCPATWGHRRALPSPG